MRPIEAKEVSVRYTLSAQDGTRLGGSTDGDPFLYTPGLEQIMPILEQAMDGAVKGDKKRIVLAPEEGRHLQVDVARLAFVLGHEGEPLVLDIEIL